MEVEPEQSMATNNMGNVIDRHTASIRVSATPGLAKSVRNWSNAEILAQAKQISALARQRGQIRDATPSELQARLAAAAAEA